MYLSIIFARFKESFIYKMDFIGNIINSLATLAVFWFIWNAIFASSGISSFKGITLSTMITYTAISLIIRIYSISYGEHFIHDDVKHGGIVLSITKPINYIFLVLSRELGSTFYKIVSNGIPTLLIAFLFLNISLPQAPIAFLISVAFAFFVNFFLIALVGLWSFWAGSIWGLRFSKNVISEVTSGSVFPLFFFPEWFRQIAYFLPFQAIYNIPLSIYTGQIIGFEIITSLFIQLFWCFSLGLLTLVVWRFAQRRIYVQGG